jgi:hypothetical protein
MTTLQGYWLCSLLLFVRWILDCDEYDVWPLIADDLSSRLPLKNLVWYPSDQRAERHIQSLEVDLKRFNFEQIPQPLSHTQTNYLNLYFVSCDVSCDGWRIVWNCLYWPCFIIPLVGQRGLQKQSTTPNQNLGRHYHHQEEPRMAHCLCGKPRLQENQQLSRFKVFCIW